MCLQCLSKLCSLGTPRAISCNLRYVQVEDLILSELKRLKTEGFSSTAVEAALNSIEFDLRENNTGSFPRGLSLMLRSMSSWIYDKDPFQPLQWTDSLEHFKVRLHPPLSCSCSETPRLMIRSSYSLCTGLTFWSGSR